MAAVSQPFRAPTVDLSPPTASAVEELPSYDDARAHALTSNLQRGSSTLRRDSYISEHSFSIRTGKGIPWLTMHLRSRATSAKYLPLYCNRDVIRGDVTLQLQADMRVKAIVLKVRMDQATEWQNDLICWQYRCTVSEQGSVPHHDIILDVEHFLWTPDGGAPFGVLSKGRHVIPIIFRIPHEIPNPKESGTMAALPPTFSESGGSAVYVNYTVREQYCRGILIAELNLIHSSPSVFESRDRRLAGSERFPFIIHTLTELTG